MDIISELNAFDGKHTDVLETLARRLPPEPSLVHELCEITAGDRTRLQTAATWLLKRYQETGLIFSTEQTGTLLDLLIQATHWEAKLHLLQTMPNLIIPAELKSTLYDTLKQNLNDKNKMVRAWSYNGLAILAEQHTEFRDEVADLLAAGQVEEAASVKARIRNILKGNPWALKA